MEAFLYACVPLANKECVPLIQKYRRKKKCEMKAH